MAEKLNPDASPTIVATADADKQAPPTTCKSFISQLKKAKANSNGPVEFCKAVSAVFDSTQSPTWESMFGKVKEKTTDSTGKLYFCKILTFVIGCSVVGLVVIGLAFALPIAEIVIGKKHLDDCPAEPYIPIYLIVTGVLGLLLMIPTGGSKQDKTKNSEDDEDVNKKCREFSCGSAFKSLIKVLIFCWFIAGNVWVYRLAGEWVAEPSTAVNYCHSTVYNLAFWVITGTYIFIGVGILSFIVIALGFLCFCAFSDDKCYGEKCL